MLSSTFLSILALASSASAQTPSQATLKANQYPDWFRDGKLGIWAHWGPQSVPMMGDWYARNMYEQGSGQYNDHLARFGHPSLKGYKDIIPEWKAEKWDPARLMKLYKQAGAKYFVSMGVHHDNFDLWNSTYHRWNAVKMGPHRDIVGTWQQAAKKEGLRFGVSEHLGASFTWFQVSRGADKTGPQAGAPYDGNDPAYEDLYHAKTKPGDTGWYTNDPVFQAEWFKRISDLVDQYHPDLLYSDGAIPFGHFGEDLVAHLYEDSKARHGGKQEAVYNCKQVSNGQWVQDVERGVLAGIDPNPWQIDTSIGDWFYNKNWKFRGADWVIHTLVDVVSKNGNLLINVVQRPDGSLDPEAEQVLADMSAWMKINGASIYGTRPWIAFGEGPTRAKGGAFKEDFGFSAQDIRFATKGDGTLFATMMGQPTPGEIVLKSLSNLGTKATIRSVSILGQGAKVTWSWQNDGLHVTIPAGEYSPLANVIKISGKNLRSFELPKPPVATDVKPDANGIFRLLAGAAELSTGGIAVETKDGQENLGYWDSTESNATWTLDVPAPGTYEVVAEAGTQNPPTSLTVQAGDAKLSGTIRSTGSWDKFETMSLGQITVTQSGKLKLTARPTSAESWHPINLRSITLKPIP